MAEQITVFAWVKRVFPSKLGRFRKGKEIAAIACDKDVADAVVNLDSEPLYLRRVYRDNMVRYGVSDDTEKDRLFLIQRHKWEMRTNKNVWTASIKRERGDEE